jgi:hypothetical protein
MMTHPGHNVGLIKYCGGLELIAVNIQCIEQLSCSEMAGEGVRQSFGGGQVRAVSA